MNSGMIMKGLLAAVLVPTIAFAQAGAPPTVRRGMGGSEPSVGVAFSQRRGLSVEAQGGVFTTFAGQKGASNAQPYTALSIGIDLGESAGFTGFFTLGQGSSASSCRYVDGGNNCVQEKLSDGSKTFAADSFNMVMAEVGGRYLFKEAIPRLGLYGALSGGLTVFAPGISQTASMFSPHVGIGFGAVYLTRLPGLAVGAEITPRFTFTPLIPSFAGFARVQYTF